MVQLPLREWENLRKDEVVGVFCDVCDIDVILERSQEWEWAVKVKVLLFGLGRRNLRKSTAHVLFIKKRTCAQLVTCLDPHGNASRATQDKQS